MYMDFLIGHFDGSHVFVMLFTGFLKENVCHDCHDEFDRQDVQTATYGTNRESPATHCRIS